jgi:hypothetical protein
MFYNCTHDNFAVNSVFRFPLLSQANVNKGYVFFQTFFCDTNSTYPRPSASIATILNGNPTPSDNRNTFITYDATQGANRWADWSATPINWGGAGCYFKFTINTQQTDTGTAGTEKTFSVPTSNAYAYDWNINWGDGTATERKTGTGASTSAGIAHTYSAAGQYQITITPAGSTTGWFKAFGFSDNTSGANVQTNKNKVVSPDTSITVGMFAVPGATSVGNDVCRSWFHSCKGKNFKLRADFRFAADWNNVTTVGNNFCLSMFNDSSPEYLPDWNLPTGITTVGTAFCSQMFFNCISTFNPPVSFEFPLLSQTEINKTDVFYRTFYCNKNVTYFRQPRTATLILNGNPVPPSARGTFFTYDATQGANRWNDYNSLNANWK